MSDLSLIELDNHYSYYSVNGDKAQQFLQGQLTCDLTQLSSNQSLMGAYLSPKGRVIATVRIFLFDNTIILQLPADMATPVITRLTKIALLSKVKLSAIAFKTFGILFDNDLRAITAPSFISLPISEHLALVISPLRLSWPIAHHHLSQSEWQKQFILAKQVEVNSKISEQFTCHDLDFHHSAVSFTKGCYVGQEIVARMQYLGKLKSHLQLLITQTPPALDLLETIHNEQQQVVGTVVAHEMIDEKNYCLILIKDEALKFALFNNKQQQLNLF